MDATLQVAARGGTVSDLLSLPSERRLQEEVRKEAAHQMESLRRSRRGAPFCAAVGDVIETVTEEARREQADLILLGRGSLPNTLGRLHTHVYGIIQQSPCPVLSV